MPKNNWGFDSYCQRPIENQKVIPRRRYPIGTGRHLAGELEVVCCCDQAGSNRCTP
jgi:hypothetical protein